MPRKAKPMPEGTPEIGKAFVCKDGYIRWVFSISTRRRLYLLLSNPGTPEGGEECRVWRFGGIVKPEEWIAYHGPGEPFPVPKEGDIYRRAGVFGGWFEKYIPLPDDTPETIDKIVHELREVSAMDEARYGTEGKPTQ